jgi:hypothetical protein
MRRTVAGIVIGALALSGLAMAVATPAGAGGPCSGNLGNAPDGRIRRDGGAWVGGSAQYPTAQVNQVFGNGQSAAYELQWRMVFSYAQTIRVRLEDVSSSGYGIKYFVNGVNVSQTFRDGKTLKFQHLEPGKRTPKIVVVIKNKGAVTYGGAILHGYYAGFAQPNACDQLIAFANLS